MKKLRKRQKGESIKAYMETFFLEHWFLAVLGQFVLSGVCFAVSFLISGKINNYCLISATIAWATFWIIVYYKIFRIVHPKKPTAGYTSWDFVLAFDVLLLGVMAFMLVELFFL